MTATLEEIITTYDRENKKYINLYMCSSPLDLSIGFSKLYPGKGHFVSLAKENPNTVIVDGQFRCMWIDENADPDQVFSEVKDQLPIHLFGISRNDFDNQYGHCRLNYGFSTKFIFIANVAVEFTRGHGTITGTLLRDIRQPFRTTQTFEIE